MWETNIPWLLVFSAKQSVWKNKGVTLQTQGLSKPGEGKLMDSQTAVSSLILARYEQRGKLGMKMVVLGLMILHLHSPEKCIWRSLLPDCLTLMLPGSETPLHGASRPGPLSLLNPAYTHFLPFCPLVARPPLNIPHG